MTTSWNQFVTMSATVRPASTAERAIGSERKRSVRPFCRSSVIPMPVTVPPKAIDCTRIPGSRKSTYDTPGVWIAPPNT
jgi:hypothetical protein